MHRSASACSRGAEGRRPRPEEPCRTSERPEERRLLLPWRGGSGSDASPARDEGEMGERWSRRERLA